MRMQIRGGRVIDPANHVDKVADVFIADGKIVAVANKLDGFTADKQIDAKGAIVCPGFIDLYGSVREPGYTHKGTIESETGAAAAGGITTICYPPDTKPVIDSSAVVKSIIQKSNAVGKAKILPVGALTRGLAGQQIAEMAGLKEAGCVAVGNASMPVVDSMVMRRAMEYAVSCNLPVFLYSEDAFLRGKGCVHEGPVATRLGLSSIPEIAETLAVARDIALAQLTGARVHFCRISTAGAVDLIRQAQTNGLPVTANVTAHHLHLLDIDVAGFDSSYHVRPPLRSQRDRDALRQALADGVISAICSDHQPHDLDAKLGPFGETESGIASFETLLPLGLRLVADGLISLSQMIAALTVSPANVLNLDCGRLSSGAPADVCIFYQDKYWTADANHWQSRGQNTPFFGRELQGRVVATVCNGQLVYADISVH